jgi:hypothetical protein
MRQTRGRAASKDDSATAAKKQKTVPHDVNDEYDIDEREIDLMHRVIGFSAFSSSKGKDHSATDCSYVKKISKRKSRQYVKPK